MSLKKYAKFKHHAWAGLGFLSIILAINHFIPIPKIILIPILPFLILYIFISLLFTYKYREELAKQAVRNYNEIKNKIKKKSEKNKLKLEKKK